MSKYSFKSLFDATFDLGDGEKATIKKVVVPRIQRDYAQGRKKRGEDDRLNDQGRRFIDNIFTHLEEGNSMEMDFIYGAIENGKLLPLDGQQRLTTLYLLYWYFGIRELKNKDDLYALLKKFSYETRASARQFCEKLSSEIEVNFDEGLSISEQLRDFSWYSRRYDQDPTIVAMMNMMDEIHKRYCNLEQSCYYEHLDKFTFSLLPLNRFHLTDELYIKMNARGKQLTNFENLKADLTNWMTKCEGLSEFIKYNDREMPHHMVFSNKLDNEWTNTVWELSKKIDNTTIDELFLSLFYRWFLFEYIFESESTNKEMSNDMVFKFFEAESEYADLKPFESLLTLERIKRLEKALDLFSDNQESILQDAIPSWEELIPTYMFKNGITLPQRVVLYGVWRYLDRIQDENFCATKFKQWMRVVWNIVENTDIDSWRSAIGVLKLLKELGESSDDIYNRYPETLNATSSAADEERRKVLFINENPSWEEAFIKAEKHPFLRGGIGFMVKEKMEIKEFQNRAEMAYEVFDKNGIKDTYRIEEKQEHLLLRAIISKYSSFEQLKNRNFTDTDDKEHYLKKMLAGDKVVKEAICEWLTLESKEYLKQQLQAAVAEDSRMQDIRFEKKMHEELYKEPNLQKWMQANKAFRFSYHYYSGSYFVSRPGAWYDWVMLDSYRDEMINKIAHCYSLAQPNLIPETIYHKGKSIELKREVQLNEDQKVTFIYIFHEDGFLRVGIKEGLAENNHCLDKLSNVKFDEDDKASGWICRKKYNYKEVTDPNKVELFLQEIEEEVFNSENPSSLISQIFH